MTEQTADAAEPTPEAWQRLAEATEAAIESDGGAPTPAANENAETENDETPSKREARYRTQLREAEAERDQLRTTVETIQRAEVERVASQTIKKPEALWANGAELASLIDEHGAVDAAAVTAAAEAARDTLGLQPIRHGYVPTEGRVVGQPAPANAWESAFKPPTD
jgi:hypothetical protein